MERMMKSIKVLLIAAILVVALSTCSNPFDWVATVTDEVMVANHKYLEVLAVKPVKDEPAFSQDDPILIDFNRDIDLSSVTDATIVLVPSTTWTSSFDTGTDRLKIIPDLLPPDQDYQVTVNAGVKGTDGSVLRDPYTWNFHAIPAPTGNVKINNDAMYTKSATVTLNVTANSYVTHMRWAQSEVDLASTPYVAVAATVNSYGLIGGEGTRTVYMQFRDNTPPYRETNVKQDTIILDMTPPTVDAGPQRLVNASATTTPAPTASDLNGIQGYLWTGVSCSPSADVLVPTFNNPGADGNYTVTLSVTDNAGNVGSDTMILTRDGTAPSLAPTFITVPATPSILPNPTWSWQGNSVNSWGGETPKLFRYRLNWLEPRELTWKPYDAYATMVPDTQYTAPYDPPKYLGLPNSKYMNTAYEPILYRMTVWEMDKAGNLSPPGTAADITVTTVLPYNNSTGVGLTPLLRWRNILDPETGRPARYYIAHFGYFRTGVWVELISPKEIEAQVGLESSWPVYKDVIIRAGYTFGWYIEAPDFRLRSPVNGVIDRDDYWTFAP